MLHRFRTATGMNKKRFNDLFLHRSELVAKTKPGDNVVLFDDFSATGKQACDAWRDVFAELLSAGQKVYLVLVAATEDALDKIADETEMSAVCNTVLR